MMLRVFCLVTLLSAIALPSCGKTASPAPIYKHVDADGGLRMRSKPDTSGEILGTIPKSTKVRVLEERGNALTISGRQGRWMHVQWEGKQGWVFGGFLSNAPKAAAMGVGDIQSALKGKRFRYFDGNGCVDMIFDSQGMLKVGAGGDKESKHTTRYADGVAHLRWRHEYCRLSPSAIQEGNNCSMRDAEVKVYLREGSLRLSWGADLEPARALYSENEECQFR